MQTFRPFSLLTFFQTPVISLYGHTAPRPQFHKIDLVIIQHQECDNISRRSVISFHYQSMKHETASPTQ